VLLQAANDGHEVQRASSAEAKQEQLITLLNKAQQYSQFIVNSQSDSLAATAQSKAPRTNGEAKAASDGNPKSKKRKLDDASASPTSLSEGFVDAAKRSSDGQSKSRLVEQPKTMIGGTLKGYQVEGLRWMATLYENGLSGILADEMGLGKTIQVIALVAHLREMNVSGPIIIAAPLATLPNWVKEFRKWTPSIHVLQYHGGKKVRAELRRTLLSRQRQKTDDFPVIVTSYEVCIMDRTPLSKFDFKYLVVDEGQRVKNRDCRLVRELKKLRTENRLLLSGTPIQNTLEELWSLLNFVNPDIFDDLRVFQSWFGFRNIGQETQVDDILSGEVHDQIVSKLHEILRPFLLRRVKADVLAHLLPPKREIVVYAPMARLQQRYEIELREHRLRETLVKSGVPAGRELSQQNMLMNRRKNANHPFLFGEPLHQSGRYITELAPKSLVSASGKFQLLDRLLPELKRRGHKVLLFSQMTEVLNLVEDHLDQLGYAHFRIDGGVKLEDRQSRIEAFNAEPDGRNDLFVFLLSTRAGGLGINLAAADTCIIFDSDWNPQQDSQAMDRCHRIGQKRPVVVYRLLTAGSVEISMIEKQLSKKKLERMAITGGDFKRAGQRSTGRDFSVDHLRELLADDVDLAQRVGGSGDKSNGEENGETSTHAAETPSKPVDRISDAELDLILDRRRIFDKDDPIPLEGDHYDVVVDAVTDGGILGKVQ